MDPVALEGLRRLERDSRAGRDQRAGQELRHARLAEQLGVVRRERERLEGLLF